MSARAYCARQRARRLHPGGSGERKTTNKLGFIDKSGRVVIEPLFRETSGFAEGLAAVKIIGSDGEYVWEYIDRAGGFAIAPQFREAHPFEGCLARVHRIAPDGFRVRVRLC